MEIELIFKIAGIGIIVAILNQVLAKSGREEYALLTVFAGILVVALMLLPQLGGLYDAVESFFEM